mmetsp:Transcript_4222/g.13485  ORF Transcript_4222/g.13485 Transcript_4222/m.13485 type:complete len:217 (-) Transcript_4222:1106-1756(-)
MFRGSSFAGDGGMSAGGAVTVVTVVGRCCRRAPDEPGRSLSSPRPVAVMFGDVPAELGFSWRRGGVRAVPSSGRGDARTTLGASFCHRLDLMAKRQAAPSMIVAMTLCNASSSATAMTHIAGACVASCTPTCDPAQRITAAFAYGVNPRRRAGLRTKESGLWMLRSALRSSAVRRRTTGASRGSVADAAPSSEVAAGATLTMPRPSNAREASSSAR